MWASVVGIKPSVVFVQCPVKAAGTEGLWEGVVVRRDIAVVDDTQRGYRGKARGGITAA